MKISNLKKMNKEEVKNWKDYLVSGIAVHLNDDDEDDVLYLVLDEPEYCDDLKRATIDGCIDFSKYIEYLVFHRQDKQYFKLSYIAYNEKEDDPEPVILFQKKISYHPETKKFKGEEI